MLRSDCRGAGRGQGVTSGVLVEGGLTDTVGTRSFAGNSAGNSGLRPPQCFLAHDFKQRTTGQTDLSVPGADTGLFGNVENHENTDDQI